MDLTTPKVSSLLDSLPAVLQADRQGRQPNFLGRFLLGFEKLLLGLGEPQEPGLEEIVATLYRFFEPGEKLPAPERAPSDFLPWLAGWLALTLRSDWEDDRKRHLIASASRLYRLRGTRAGVEEFLQIYTDLGVTVVEFPSFQIGRHSRVGVDTYVNGVPFYFHVSVQLPAARLADRALQIGIISAIVDLQKPAHTHYTLAIVTPRFEVGTAVVGRNTLLTE